MTAQSARRRRAVDVWKVYGSGEAQVVALRGVNVELASGPVHRDHGPVGLGQVDADALPGRARLGDPRRGVHRRHQAHRHVATGSSPSCAATKVGFIFQQFNLLPTLSAEENILLPLSIAGRKPDRQWFDTVIDTVGLRDRLGHRPSQLSGGQQQRVACARALVAASRGGLRRRADRQPRLAVRRRGARLPAQLGARVRPDHRDGHPRPERGLVRRPGGVPRRRRGRRRAARPDRRGACSTG